MKNPLNKRLPREFTGEIAKYLVIFVFMTAVIGLISGFLIADGSMYNIMKALRSTMSRMVTLNCIQRLMTAL